MTYRVLPMAPEYIESFRETSDAVFRESQMHAFFQAPALEQVSEFVLGVIRDNDPQFVAVVDSTVVGWCDVLRKPRPAMRHTGVLGIGVLKVRRGQGIGTSLMTATLNAANARGFTRIELYVRTDNEPAKRLYERFGFKVEGTLRKHLLIGGAYRDSFVMSLVNE